MKEQGIKTCSFLKKTLDIMHCIMYNVINK